MLIIGIILAVIVVGTGSFFAYTAYQQKKVENMTGKDMLSYMTGNEKTVITVGIVKNGEKRYTLYGNNGTILPQTQHIYEIGSLTKTVTASLLLKAVSEGKINLDDSIDKYLDLPEKDYYPTIKRLITHRSGYKRSYLDARMVLNFFAGRNYFYGVSVKTLMKRIGNTDLKDRDYQFAYSNFGISVVGAVLSKVYEEQDGATMINAFVEKELGLRHTKISDGSGDLSNYWEWKKNDAYVPAGALISNMEDMLAFAQMQLQKLPAYLSDTHVPLAEINTTSRTNAKMNIRMDSIGAAWIIDRTHDIVWHNGGTGGFNSYLGFDLSRQIAVVVLSNLSPFDRIPATVLGARLLIDLQEDETVFPQYF